MTFSESINFPKKFYLQHSNTAQYFMQHGDKFIYFSITKFINLTKLIVMFILNFISHAQCFFTAKCNLNKIPPFFKNK